ncbi:GHKL domain-containing protein [Agathobacter rectalis]|uniref:GHKL domain-containing protein n=2 Tax=Lachnospiraceae TaxID=186803 RepID=A0A414IUE4_9FIRM|nr:GHKL domain-containing protein [Agathobacter rectalis]RGT18674.1 GHKL domain-containing protein [Agathobacter rectalis]RHE32363.1 GHKL domain-containing protein [Agathobacter rectalis]
MLHTILINSNIIQKSIDMCYLVEFRCYLTKNHPHGIGIKNVRKVVSDLNGQIDISYTDNTHIRLLLPHNRNIINCNFQ